VKRLALAALAALLATPAAAESPRWGSFEIGTGPFRPDIDSDFTPPGPYEQVYGNGRRWQLSVGLSKAVYRGWGTVELGARSGWFRANGKGLITDDTGTTTQSGDKTTLNIVPTSLIATYRADLFYDRWNVPLVPYLRLALERYNWWVTEGDGSWAEKGATNGWSSTLGLAFPLDVIDTKLARETDRDNGINTTYLYGDVTWSHVDDFGAGDSWDLSGHGITYTFGLLMVF
jgi:hypothetical protein